jgi:Fur family zinc uptake transcriptional regulator
MNMPRTPHPARSRNQTPAATEGAPVSSGDETVAQGADPYGFSPHTRGLLECAATLCARQGGRMTPQRRDVLGLILQAEAPVGAYDLLEQLRVSDRRPAPPTVYRALDFLLEHGLIHRIERLSAFVSCTHLSHEEETDAAGASASQPVRSGHAVSACGHEHAACGVHAAQFLICRACGGVTEIADAPRILDMLRTVCREKEFVMQSASVEVEGLCAACAGRQTVDGAREAVTER